MGAKFREEGKTTRKFEKLEGELSDGREESQKRLSQARTKAEVNART